MSYIEREEVDDLPYIKREKEDESKKEWSVEGLFFVGHNEGPSFRPLLWVINS